MSTSSRSTRALRASDADAVVRVACDGLEARSVRRAAGVDLDDLAGLGVLERQQAHGGELTIEPIAESDGDHVVSLRESAELGSRLLDIPLCPSRKSDRIDDDRAPAQRARARVAARRRGSSLVRSARSATRSWTRRNACARPRAGGTNDSTVSVKQDEPDAVIAAGRPRARARRPSRRPARAWSSRPRRARPTRSCRRRRSP